MPRKAKRACWYLVALLTTIVIVIPEAASAQRGPGMASPGVRDACRAHVRGLGIRGTAGGNGERHRLQCSGSAWQTATAPNPAPRIRH